MITDRTPKLYALLKQNPNLLGSGKMVAIVECLMGIPFEDRSTDCKIAAICVTTDGGILAMHEGDIGYNDFMGDSEDLRRNLLGLAEHFNAEDEGMALINQVRRAGVNS